MRWQIPSMQTGYDAHQHKYVPLQIVCLIAIVSNTLRPRTVCQRLELRQRLHCEISNTHDQVWTLPRSARYFRSTGTHSARRVAGLGRTVRQCYSTAWIVAAFSDRLIQRSCLFFAAGVYNYEEIRRSSTLQNKLLGVLRISGRSSLKSWSVRRNVTWILSTTWSLVTLSASQVMI